MNFNFQPYQTHYFGTEYADQLDFFIYVPHGAFPEAFMAQHPDLEAALRITRDQFIRICRMEADTFTPELAFSVANMLQEQGCRGAVMEVLFPRELMDANRIPSHALHPVFNSSTHPDLKTILLDYHATALFQREKLIGALSDAGVFLDLHSMRHGSISTDGQIPNLCSNSDIVDYYHLRLSGLENLNPESPRSTCLITRHHDPLISSVAHPIFLRNMVSAFDQSEIQHNSDVYRFLAHILGGAYPHHYIKGLAVDLVKTGLCASPRSGRLDLADLQPDPNKMLRYVECLAGAIMATVQENRRPIQSLPTRP